ncbi:MAG: molybdopterin-guanine dinucleotide biosynthesis protein B [Ectothiorhodospiraceae bacterium]|nr:molybdopterin-guanine dinucleotide biosynthesis protein B [Ectothiorhodospiraceae bacterium]
MTTQSLSADNERPFPYRHLWPDTARCPLLGFAAWSGTGKTTLLSLIIPLLRDAGLRVGLIKHAHHEVDVDQPGKDSYRLRKAGASQVLLTTGRRWALMTERDVFREPELAEEIARIDQDSLDLLLVEGFRDSRFPKIELLRDIGRPDRAPLHLDDDSIIAVACDGSHRLPPDLPLPVLDLNDPQAMVRFICQQVLARSEIP